MRILHLTDFHYDEKNKAEQNILVEKLIVTLKPKVKPDFIFFTGDLVLKGGKRGSYFRPASEEFISRICQELSIEKGQTFICCGNHDVSRGQEIDAIKDYVDRFVKLEQIDDFVKEDKQGQFKLSLANVQSYIDFQKTFYSTEGYESDTISDLFTIHKRKCDDKTIAVVSLNSAWRSFDSKKDKDNLLFPISLLLEAIDAIVDCDIKILLMHHPISDFKEFVGYELEDKIFNNFNCLFSGHVHKSKLSTNIRGIDGIFCCVSPASLTVSDKDSTIGFSIVDIDPQDISEVEVERYVYDVGSQNFNKPSDTIVVSIPVGAEKQKLLKLKKSVRRRLENTIYTANSLFVSMSEKGDNKKGFLDLFTQPSIKTKSKAEYTRSKTEYVKANTPSMSIDLNHIQNDGKNYLIHGQDKSGKTSLLYYININLLKNFSSNRVLPYYIDCKRYSLDTSGNFEWSRNLARHYEVTNSHAVSLPNDYQIRLLIDNYDSDNSRLVSALEEFINLNDNVSFIISTNDTLSSSQEKLEFTCKSFSHLYIHDVTRSQIRGLTNKWPSIPEEKKEQAIEKILSIFKQLRIPSNYWNVSLFLWIFEKSSSASLTNNVDLIQLYIEKLLDKENLLVNKSIKINYDQLREYLGELAFYFLSKHGSETYSATFSEIVQFTTLYKASNIRFVIAENAIFKLITDKGIIKESSDDRYSFRLNGVFEYFLAVYLESNDDFRTEAIKDDHVYLSFSNEFELYAGFKRKDEDFMFDILDRTMNIFTTVNNKYGEFHSIDEVLIRKLEKLLNVSIQRIVQINEQELNILTPDEKDNMLEERSVMVRTDSEVSLKQYYNKIDINAENLEKSLTILAKVFRNTSLKDVKDSKMVLDYILQCSCHLGFFLLDEVEIHDFHQSDSEVNEKKILKVWANFIPLIIQTLLHEALAQDDLQRLLESRLNELLKEKEKNQYLIMLLYLLIIDLDPQKNIEILDDAVEAINLGILENTMLVKLFTYLVFQSYGKEEFETVVREKIRKLSLKIDPDAHRGSIDKHIEALSKAALIENARS